MRNLILACAAVAGLAVLGSADTAEARSRYQRWNRGGGWNRGYNYGYSPRYNYGYNRGWGNNYGYYPRYNYGYGGWGGGWGGRNYGWNNNWGGSGIQFGRGGIGIYW